MEISCTISCTSPSTPRSSPTSSRGSTREPLPDHWTDLDPGTITASPASRTRSQIAMKIGALTCGARIARHRPMATKLTVPRPNLIKKVQPQEIALDATDLVEEADITEPSTSPPVAVTVE